MNTLASHYKPWILLLVISAMLPGCRENSFEAGRDDAVTGTRDLQIPDQELRASAEFAIQDLASELNVDADTVSVISAEKVNWRTSAMGCPQPDRGYLQVITPGVLIRLQVAGKHYRYHGARTGNPFLCQSKTPEDPAPDNGAASPYLDDGT